ncbi:MAG: ATP-binding protein [Betaproteobacteria bacterium]|nr:ATP-binding protein [Betaproteobacteria bacterium]
MRTRREDPPSAAEPLRTHLAALNLPFMHEHHQALAVTAADKHWSHIDYLAELAAGEAAAREDRSVQRRIKLARFPVLKTLDQFDWNWPTKINRAQIQNLFHLDFVPQHGNVVFISGTGLGKSHLMTALGHAACLRRYTVLFIGAIDIINTLAAAQAAGGLKYALARYIRPQVLAIDELGYLPIDKFGADCLFQIISHRYERGATLITTNRVYKQWPTIFNNDSVLTSALLDRLLHHADTVRIEGKSYRMKDQIEV